jgi:hypothetical protein
MDRSTGKTVSVVPSTVAALPAAAKAGRIAAASDLGGGAGLLWNTGTKWRRLTHGYETKGDADYTITVLGNSDEIEAATTLTANRTWTLSATGAVAGDRVAIARTGYGSFWLIVANGGPGANTMYRLAVNSAAVFGFDGTNWRLLRATNWDDRDTLIYASAMTVPMPSVDRFQIDDFVVGLKNDGVYSTLDWLSVVALHDAQAGRINLINPTEVATANGALTFTPYRGYAGDATSAHLDTGKAINALAKLTQNSANVFGYQNVGGAAAAPLIGLTTATVTRLRPNNSGTIAGLLNGGTAASTTGSGDTGLFSLRRSSSSSVEVFRNGASLIVNAGSTSAAPACGKYRGPAIGYDVFGGPSPAVRLRLRVWMPPSRRRCTPASSRC